MSIIKIINQHYLNMSKTNLVIIVILIKPNKPLLIVAVQLVQIHKNNF